MSANATVAAGEAGRFELNVDIVGQAVPFLLAIVVLEAIWSAVAGKHLYRLNDTISSLSAGVISQLFSQFIGFLGIVPYYWVHSNFRLMDVPLEAVWHWVVLTFAVDCGYYWAHRTYHEMNLCWGGHAPHHSSEEYNFSTALRQGSLEGAFAWIFYLPLAFFFDLRAFVVFKQINTVFQFFVHTQTVGKLPAPIEWFMNTPSHHRVHHARNPQYLDKNYAGMFIIWDRMFGTYAEEEDAPIYGLLHPLQTWNPIWAQWHHYLEGVPAWMGVPGVVSKAKALWFPPGWDLDADADHQPDLPVATADELKWNAAPRSTALAWYTFAHFLITVVVAFLVFEANKIGLADSARMVLTFAAVASLTVLALINEGRAGARGLELARLAMFGGLLWWGWTAMSGPTQPAVDPGLVRNGVLAAGAVLGVSAIFAAVVPFEATSLPYNANGPVREINGNSSQAGKKVM